MALVLAAASTATSAIETFYDHRALWITYESGLNDFYGISDDLAFALAGDESVSVEFVKSIYKRIENVLRNTDKSWVAKRQEQAATKI